MKAIILGKQNINPRQSVPCYTNFESEQKKGIFDVKRISQFYHHLSETIILMGLIKPKKL